MLSVQYIIVDYNSSAICQISRAYLFCLMET